MELLGESSTMIIAGIYLTIAAFILHLIGFATPYWDKHGSTHIGLWQYCRETCEPTADNIDEDDLDKLKVVQALECLALIAFLVTVVVIVLKLFVMKDQPLLYRVMALGNCIAGGFAMLGILVYGTFDSYYSSNVNFSFLFCVFAALVAFAAGALIILGRNKQTRSEQNGQT